MLSSEESEPRTCALELIFYQIKPVVRTITSFSCSSFHSGFAYMLRNSAIVESYP